VIDGTDGSELTVGGGSGTITNNGTVRIVVRTPTQTGAVYTPILAGTWNGSGTYEAIGGAWDDVDHEFTVSAPEQGTSGTPVSIDLADVQCVLIDDPTSGRPVGASFLATQSSTSLDFTATVLGETAVGDLKDLLEDDQGVRSAWDFTVSGGPNPDDPTYLSFDIGPGHDPDHLTVWHYDGDEWTEYEASDLIYDGTYASFSVTGFSAYGMITQCPPGDTDGDYIVDEGDAMTLAAHWGQSGSWAEGDFDGDGVVGPRDAAILAANWGFGTGGELSAVPEPGVLVTLLIGALMLLVRRSR